MLPGGNVGSPEINMAGRKLILAHIFSWAPGQPPKGAVRP